MNKYLITLFITTLIFQNAIAGQKITILGREFSFMITEPTGWQCECEGDKAATIGANLAMWKKNETMETAQPLIYARVNSRGKSPADDMSADMEGALKHNSKLKFKDFKVDYSKGESSAKIFKIGKEATEYVVFIYPEKSEKNGVSITMHVDNREATAAEIKTFKEVVASITWMSDEVKLKKPNLVK